MIIIKIIDGKLAHCTSGAALTVGEDWGERMTCKGLEGRRLLVAMDDIVQTSGAFLVAGLVRSRKTRVIILSSLSKLNFFNLDDVHCLKKRSSRFLAFFEE